MLVVDKGFGVVGRSLRTFFVIGLMSGAFWNASISRSIPSFAEIEINTSQNYTAKLL